jgi:hypothetical protein
VRQHFNLLNATSQHYYVVRLQVVEENSEYGIVIFLRQVFFYCFAYIHMKENGIMDFLQIHLSYEHKLRACLAGLRLLQKRLRLWLLWWSGFSGGVESF